MDSSCVAPGIRGFPEGTTCLFARKVSIKIATSLEDRGCFEGTDLIFTFAMCFSKNVTANKLRHLALYFVQNSQLIVGNILLSEDVRVYGEPLPMAYVAETVPYFQRHERLK